MGNQKKDCGQEKLSLKCVTMLVRKIGFLTAKGEEEKKESTSTRKEGP